MPAKGAGEVHSIRLPSGMAAEIREISGQRVSTLARTLLEAYLKRAKAEAGREQSNA